MVRQMCDVTDLPDVSSGVPDSSDDPYSPEKQGHFALATDAVTHNDGHTQFYRFPENRCEF